MVFDQQIALSSMLRASVENKERVHDGGRVRLDYGPRWVHLGYRNKAVYVRPFLCVLFWFCLLGVQVLINKEYKAE